MIHRRLRLQLSPQNATDRQYAATTSRHNLQSTTRVPPGNCTLSMQGFKFHFTQTISPDTAARSIPRKVVASTYNLSSINVPQTWDIRFEESEARATA